MVDKLRLAIGVSAEHTVTIDNTQAVRECERSPLSRLRYRRRVADLVGPVLKSQTFIVGDD